VKLNKSPSSPSQTVASKTPIFVDFPEPIERFGAKGASAPLEKRGIRMSNFVTDKDVVRRVDAGTIEVIDVLGPTIEFLSSDEGENDPCVMRGIIPPGVTVPLHSHPEPETLIAISGRLEGLKEAAGNFEWVLIGRGDVFHIPGGVKHAIRNQSDEPANIVIAAPASTGRFFREIGTPIAPNAKPFGPPSANVIKRFMEISKRYGYWNATPEENARVGIFFVPPP
jgi:quercetin dioxygenase-like cupin family protein